METLERNRVFSKSELEELLTAGTSLFNQAISITNGFRSQVSKVKQYAGRVPSEAKDYALDGALSALNASIFETDIYSDMIERLTKLVGKILENVYLYDGLAANAAQEIAASMEMLGGMAEGLKELLQAGVINRDMNEFVQELSKCQAKWVQCMIGIEEKLKMSVTVLKGMQDCNELSKDPVNLSTGNFVYKKTDLVIGGKEPLVFYRFYNGMDRRKGCMGRGWRHSFETSLLIQQEGIILIRADGKEVTFTKKSSYVFRDTLTGKQVLHKAGEGYRHLDPEGTMYTFDSEGKLIGQMDKGGCHISFTYNQDKQLAKAAVNSGSFMEFFYGNGQLQSLCDHTGRKVQFLYERKQLRQVTDPCNNVTEYLYGGNNRIEAIRNEEGIETVRNEYDENRRITRQTFPDGGVMLYEYDDRENQVKHVEPNGNHKIYASDDRMRHTATIHEDGMERYMYDINNNCTAHIDKNGNCTRYEYDKHDRPVKVINSLGEEETIRYNMYGQPVCVCYADETKKTAEYDRQGRLEALTDENGDKIQFSYAGGGKTVNIYLPDGSTEEIIYDERGNISCVKGADGTANVYRYDALNRVTESEDGNGNKSAYEYDGCSRLTRIINPAGFSRSFSYNRVGNLIKRKNFDGGILTVGYGVTGKAESITDEDGNTVNYTYDEMGNKSSVIYPEGGTYEFCYNKQNLLEKEIRPDGSVLFYFYDKVGNCIRKIDEGCCETLYEYDKLNRLIITKEADGREIHQEYDKRGRLSKVWDNKGYLKEQTYDACGRLLTIMDNAGRSEEYTYNCLGLPVTRKTGENTIRYEYGKGGVLKSLEKDDGTRISYSYDKAGNVIKAVYQDNIVYTYRYDSMNRMISIGENGEIKTELSYDPEGRLTEVYEWGEKKKEYRYSKAGRLLYAWEAGNSPISYSYDAAGRMKGITWEAEEKRIISYKRDPMGRITEVQDAMGYREYYTYDCYGHISSMTDREGRMTEYQVLPDGRLLGCRYADGSCLELEYDALKRLKRIQDMNIMLEVSYTENGKLSSVTGHNGGETVYHYTESGKTDGISYDDGSRSSYRYDVEGKLKDILFGDERISFRYDERGNLLSKRYPGRVEAGYSYDKYGRLSGFALKAGEAILEKQEFLYGRNGLRTAVFRQTGSMPEKNGWYYYGYDNAGRLASVRHGEEETVSYRYDLFGNRTVKLEKGEETIYNYDRNWRLTEELSRGTRKQYVYDRNGQLLQARLNGETEREYSAGTHDALAVLYGRTDSAVYEALRQEQEKAVQKACKDGRSFCYEPENNFPAAGSDGERVWFYLTDEAGSPLYVTDAAGNLQEGRHYGIFGEEESGSGMPGDIGFHGFWRNADGTFRAGRRIYDPSTGRFQSEDIEKGNIHDPSGMNLYVYGRSNPLLYRDRTGNTPGLIGNVGGRLAAAAEEVLAGAKKMYEVGSAARGCIKQKAASFFNPGYDAKAYQSAECNVSISLDTIYAMAGIPEGNQILRNSLPEDSYVFQTVQYRDGVNHKDYDRSIWEAAAGSRDAMGEVIAAEFSCALEGWNKGWSDLLGNKDAGALKKFWLGDWEGRREADEALEKQLEAMVEGLLDSRELHALFELDNEIPMASEAWKTAAAVRYTLDGYSAEDALKLAEANGIQNEKHVVTGMVMNAYRGAAALTNPGKLEEDIGKLGKQWLKNQSPLRIMAALAFGGTGGLMNMAAWDMGKAARDMVLDRLETYLYAEDEEAFKAMGADYETLIETALGAALGASKQKKAAIPEELADDVGDAVGDAVSGGNSVLKETDGLADDIGDEVAKFYDDVQEVPATAIGEGGLEPGTLSNVDARKWYLEQEAKIPDLIDDSLPLEQQARQAFELRNQYRMQARELMSDRQLAESLYATDPNLTWEQIIQKQIDKGLSGDDIYKAIIESSQRSRTSVNQSLGLE